MTGSQSAPRHGSNQDPADRKLVELVRAAAAFLESIDGEDAKSISQAASQTADACWRAYVSLERAILHLKLAARMDEVFSAKPAADKRRFRREQKAEVLQQLKVNLTNLEKKLEGRNAEELLADLRGCRDAAKFLVASYDLLSPRRSTTS